MEWYYFRKRKHVVPLQFPIVYFFFSYTRKNLGLKVGPILIVHDGKENAQQTVINLDGFNRVGKNFLQRVINNPKFLWGQVVKSRVLGTQFVKWCRRCLRRQGLSGLNNKDLVNLLFRYQKQYEKFALTNICWWVFLEDRIAIEINKSLVRNKFRDDEIQEINNNLFSPTEISYVQKENLDFLKILDLVEQNNKFLLKNLALFRKNKIIYSRFKKLVDKYFWIPWDYCGPKIWGEKYYFDKIKNYLKNKIDSKEEILKFKRESKKLKLKQKELIKKLKIPQTIINLTKSLQAQAVLQDDKKAITTETHFYLGNLLSEISKRINVPKNELYLLSFDEVSQLLLEKNISKIIKDLKRRHKFCLVIIKEGKLKIFSGDKALKIAKLKNVKMREEVEIVKEIKGVCACPGKIKGRVRNLPNASYIDEFRDGEILVTLMTTPDYVPVLKKAAAILTDEGGLTSHAAIVSRELGIPCIIGTKIATKVLKDGQMVEVDATKGVARIIK